MDVLHAMYFQVRGIHKVRGIYTTSSWEQENTGCAVYIRCALSTGKYGIIKYINDTSNHTVTRTHNISAPMYSLKEWEIPRADYLKQATLKKLGKHT
jgi:hypothetical protein